jgi:DNA-binding NarL/FixJ family response regulator
MEDVAMGEDQRIQFTQRELQVISLLKEGQSNKQIALQLDICTRTVEYHLTRIYEKLEANSRAEAIIKLIHLYEK